MAKPDDNNAYPIRRLREQWQLIFHSPKSNKRTFQQTIFGGEPPKKKHCSNSIYAKINHQCLQALPLCICLQIDNVSPQEQVDFDRYYLPKWHHTVSTF